MAYTKKQRVYWAKQFPLYSWWVIAGVVALLAIRRAIIALAHFQRRRALLAQRSSETSSKEIEAPVLSSSSAIARTSTSLGAAAGKVFSWRDYGVGLWKQSSNELFWSISYTAALLAFGFTYIDLSETTTKGKWIVVGNRMGDLVYIQLPFVIGLAAKNNVISCVTGVSHEKLNFLHRSSSRACVLLSWFHTFARSVAIPLGHGHEIWRPIMIAGVVSLLAMSLMVIAGWKPLLRSMAYETFLYSHIVFGILSIAGLIVHDKKSSIYVWPSFVVWGFDRIARFLRTIVLNKMWLSFASATNESGVASVEALGSSALRITLRRSLLQSWTAGQHAFLVCPTVSTLPFESHPFTIASIPSENKGESELVFIVGVRDGFTRKLALKAADAGGSVSVPCYLDGPYGNVKSADSYSSVSLIAGGSGVTYTLPLLLNLVRQAKEGKAPVRHISFIWTVRSIEHIAWISKTLDAVRASCPTSVVLDIKIFVTRSSLALESGLETPASVSNGNGSDSDANSIEVNRLGANTNQSSFEDFEEKVVEGGNEKAGRKASEFEHALGRPDVACLLREAIAEAKGGATSITVCGPRSLVLGVRSSLASWNGETYSVGDAASGKVGAVDLHVESFDW